MLKMDALEESSKPVQNSELDVLTETSDEVCNCYIMNLALLLKEQNYTLLG